MSRPKSKKKATSDENDDFDDEEPETSQALIESMAKLMKEQSLMLERLQRDRDNREERLMREREKREDEIRREQREQHAKWLEMQKEAEQARMRHELDLCTRQQEYEERRHKTDQKNKLADKLVKWEDRDQPQDYLIRFEDTMIQAEIPEDQWPHRLRPLLSGRALVAYSRDVEDKAKGSYPELKDALLNSLGVPVKQCRERIWSFQRNGSDSHQDTARTLDFLMQRSVHGCESVKDVVSQLTLAKFLTLYPPEVANYVQLQDPRSAGEAANLVQEYYQRQQSRDHRRPYSQKPWMKPYERSAGGFRDDGRKPGAVDYEAQDNIKLGESGHRGSGNPGGAGRGSGEQRDWVPTCYSCGKKGHKRPDCPNRVRQVSRPMRERSLRVFGHVGQHECQMVIDSGAQATVVDSDLVKPDEYTGKVITLLGFDGRAVTAPVAKVWFHIGDYCFRQEVAACKNPLEPALLGLDIPYFDYLVELEREQREARINVTTRAQAKAREQQEQEDADLSERDQANPTSCAPEHTEVVIEPDHEGEVAAEHDLEVASRDSVSADQPSIGQTLNLPKVDDSTAVADAIELEAVGDDSEALPLPNLDEKQADKVLLIEQQQQDETLMTVRSWAEKGEKGYGYQDGVMVHVCDGDMGEQLVRIVVPECRRRKVLQVSHSSLTGGHFSNRKTEAALKRAFTWPGVSRDLKIWCRSCPECQKASKLVNHRAPLKPLPVIKEPFSRIAFDLVGPLPRTKQGNKYLLTCICLGSKYPDAVPLKRVDAKSVAEAMLEVFARTGLPTEILTDQGSVFMGRLMKQLCEMLSIHQIRTSPYHPQTDGCLERWHGSLKSMLRKCENGRSDWDRLLKYVLFAYRSSPHTNTGFSPFEVIFGRPLRGPLDVLKEGWLSGDLKDMSTIDWINQLRERLSDLADIVCDRESKAKAKMKAQYDKHTTLRSFDPGTLVLVRTPDLRGKLAEIWDGPYEVTRKITHLTYELAVPSRRSKTMVAHINMLKAWHSPEAKVLRVIVAEDNGGESDQPPSKVTLSDSELTMMS